jgi:predicted patatin/cPLA2 family phospholipase
VDGGVHATVPLQRALDDGYKNIVVVLTRSVDYVPGNPGRMSSRLMRLAARAKGHSDRVVRQLGRKDLELERVLLRLRETGRDSEGRQIWVISPSAAIAGRLTSDRAVLRETADLARADTANALD